MSGFAAPYQRAPVSEIIPESMKLKGLSKSSILTGRRRMRIVPQTGNVYGPGAVGAQTQCNILIQDSAGLLDLQSCVLSYRLQSESSGASPDNNPAQTAIPDDFAWSVIQRLQVSLNSVLLDDIDYCGRRATVEVYGSASRSWYSSVGTLFGAWKFVEGRPLVSSTDGSLVRSAAAGATLAPALTVGAAPGYAVTGAAAGVVAIANGPASGAPITIPKNDVSDKLNWATIWFKNLRYANAAWSKQAEGIVFAIPMSMLSHFFRQEQYFPLRNAGQLMVQLTFAAASSCMYKGVAANPDATYKVTDLIMECDVITAHPEYTALLDEICARPEKEGFALAFDAHLVSQSTPGGVGGGGTSVTVIASKATPNLRSLHFTMQPSATINSQLWLQNSTFNCNDINQWQMRLGSLYCPAMPSQGLARNFMELASSYNAPAPSVGQASVIDYDNYMGSTDAVGASSLSYLYPFSSCYIAGYCFDTMKHGEVLTHDGISTLSQSGSQIAVDIRLNSGDVGAVTTYIRFTRVILFADSGVKVEA